VAAAKVEIGNQAKGKAMHAALSEEFFIAFIVIKVLDFVKVIS
jgi:hypothetical protein